MEFHVSHDTLRACVFPIHWKVVIFARLFVPGSTVSYSYFLPYLFDSFKEEGGFFLPSIKYNLHFFMSFRYFHGSISIGPFSCISYGSPPLLGVHLVKQVLPNPLRATLALRQIGESHRVLRFRGASRSSATTVPLLGPFRLLT